MLVVAALTALTLGAAAQDREIDLNTLEEFNEIQIARGDKIHSDLDILFPMFYGETMLTNITMKGAWEGLNPSLLNMRFTKSFLYGLELASVHFRTPSKLLDLSFGLRFTFMDFCFDRSDYTFRSMGGVWLPVPIVEENPEFRGNKSKLHANYLGAPVRLTLGSGRFKIFAGASAEYCISGHTKYKRPKHRTTATDLFNPFRATVEGGIDFGATSLFVSYGLTPLFPETLSDAKTLTIGIIAGL